MDKVTLNDKSLILLDKDAVANACIGNTIYCVLIPKGTRIQLYHPATVEKIKVSKRKWFDLLGLPMKRKEG